MCHFYKVLITLYVIPLSLELILYGLIMNYTYQF